MIWLVGAEGMLGRDVLSLLATRDLPCIATDVEVDITDRDALLRFARLDRSRRIRRIINCSGYTAVDRAEEEPDAVFRINAEGVGNIADAATELGASLIHISTDYVFDGSKDTAYTETDHPAPLGVYGRSKLEGERLVFERMEDRCVVIRTSWLYGVHGGNFVHTMLKLFHTRNEVRVVNDQWGSPTFTCDLAEAILAVILRERPGSTIYNFCNSGRTTWYEFARQIHRSAAGRGLVAADVAIRPVPTSEYPTRAARPRNSTLSTDRIQMDFGITPRPWQDALESMMEGVARAEDH